LTLDMTVRTAIYAYTAFAFGLVFGSFLNVVGYRVPRRESIVFPASYCPHCHQKLKVFELVPILSWMCLGGCCRRCLQMIPIRYPIVELACGVLFALTIWHFPTWSLRLVWMFLWLLLLSVVGTDLTAMRVPNVISLPAAILFIVASGLFGVQSWRAAIIGALLCYAVLYLLSVVTRGGMGLGDAKLYLSIGAMLGPFAGLESFILASCSGALVGLAMRFVGIVRKREPIAFVPHIAIGVITTVFYGAQVTNWYMRTFILHH